MRTRIFRATLALAVVVAAAVGLGSIADTMLLKAEGGEAAVVTFQHKAHSIDRTIACILCHHNMAEAGTPPCVQCHKLAAKGTPAPAEGEARHLEQAYHDSCLGCHNEPPKGTTPPTECEQCHVGDAPKSTGTTP